MGGNFQLQLIFLVSFLFFPIEISFPNCIAGDNKGTKLPLGIFDPQMEQLAEPNEAQNAI